MAEKRLVVVDDELEIAEFVQAFAEDAGYEARATTTVNDFLNVVKEFNPTVVVIDIILGVVDGIELTRHLADLKIPARVIVMTGYDPKGVEDARVVGESHGHAPIQKLQKPFSKNQFLAALDALE